MDRTYQHIFTPLTIRGITLKNRIEIAPISVFDLSGKGYWMMFQDAETGECIKIAQK